MMRGQGLEQLWGMGGERVGGDMHTFVPWGRGHYCLHNKEHFIIYYSCT